MAARPLCPIPGISLNRKNSKNYPGRTAEFTPHVLLRPVIFSRAKASKRLTWLELMIYSRRTFLRGEVLMTKAELVEKVAAQINLTKKQTEVVVNTVFQSITESLAQGKKVELRGFGSFRVRSRNARIGRNPKSGDRVNVPAKRVPFFKAGKELRELVDGELDISPDNK